MVLCDDDISGDLDYGRPLLNFRKPCIELPLCPFRKKTGASVWMMREEDATIDFLFCN